jgi:hypothetical protein
MSASSSDPQKPKGAVNKQATLDVHSQLIVDVRMLMKERDAHRDKGEFGKADGVRERLTALGVVIKDQVGGPSGWKFIDGRPNKLPAGTKQQFIPLAAQKQRQAPPLDSSGKRGREEEGGGVASSKKSKLEAAAGQKKQEQQQQQQQHSSSKAALPKDRKQSSEEVRNKAALAAVVGPKGGKGRNVNGVLIEVLKEGTGQACQNGQRVKMAYVGRLTNGKVFDASGGKPCGLRRLAAHPRRRQLLLPRRHAGLLGADARGRGQPQPQPQPQAQARIEVRTSRRYSGS